MSNGVGITSSEILFSSSDQVRHLSKLYSRPPSPLFNLIYMASDSECNKDTQLHNKKNVF